MTKLDVGTARIVAGALFVAASACAATAGAQPNVGAPPPAAMQPAPPVTGLAPPPPGGVTVGVAATPAAPYGLPQGYLPPTLEWNKGDPIPAGYHPDTEPRIGFVIAGSVTLGVTWALAGLLPGIVGLSACSDVGGSSDCAAFGTLLIPAVGPFITMIAVAGETHSSGSAVGTAYAVLAIDGLVQSAGAALLIYGLASPRDVLVRDQTTRIGNTTITWRPTPMAMGVGGQGIGITGTF